MQSAELMMCVIGILGLEDQGPFSLLETNDDDKTCILHGNGNTRCLYNYYLEDNKDQCNYEARRVADYLKSSDPATSDYIIEEDYATADLTEQLKQCWFQGNVTLTRAERSEKRIEATEALYDADITRLNNMFEDCQAEVNSSSDAIDSCIDDFAAANQTIKYLTSQVHFKENVIGNLILNLKDSHAEVEKYEEDLEATQFECTNTLEAEMMRCHEAEEQANINWARQLAAERHGNDRAMDDLKEQLSQAHLHLSLKQENLERSEDEKQKLEGDKMVLEYQLKLQKVTSNALIRQLETSLSIQSMQLGHARETLKVCRESLIDALNETTTESSAAVTSVPETTEVSFGTTEVTVKDELRDTKSAALLKKTDDDDETHQEEEEEEFFYTDEMQEDRNNKECEDVFRLGTVPWYCLVMGAETLAICVGGLVYAISTIKK